MTKAKRSFCLSRHGHESKSESSYCNWLLARKQAGEIKDFEQQHSIPLHVEGKVWKHWKIDFRVIENDGSYTFHESKGWNRSDDNFKLKLSMAMFEYPDRVFYVNKKICSFTPMNRVRCEGLVKKKNKKTKSNLYRTYCRKTKRWIIKKLEEKK